jgi:transposase InsO family protein
MPARRRKPAHRIADGTVAGWAAGLPLASPAGGRALAREVLDQRATICQPEPRAAPGHGVCRRFRAGVPAAPDPPVRAPAPLAEAQRARRAEQSEYAEEFHEVTDLEWTVPAVNRQLRQWERIYNTVRSHQALGYRHPG